MHWKNRILATVVCLLGCTVEPTQADNIFYDDMSDGVISDWTLSSSSAYLNNASGNYSIGFRGTATATKTLSSVGYNRVTVSMMLAASSLESADVCLAEMSINGGTSWVTLFSIGDGADDNVFRIGVAAPTGAENNANLRFRFRAATGSTGDYCYGDDVQISGDDGIDTESFATLPGTGVVNRTALTYTTLTTATGNGNLLDFSAYAMPTQAAQPSNVFQGRLSLSNTATSGGFTEVVDSYSYTGTADTTRKHLPPFDFEFVQNGSHFIPKQRESIASTHPEWEYLLMPGRVWNENSDNGFSRVALPFALHQKNANCTHTGVMTFLFKNDGAISKVAYQIASETCLYFKVNMWGLLPAMYTPAAVSDSATVIANHQNEITTRLPVRALEEIKLDYPALDVAKLAASNSNDPKHVSVVGFLKNGVHYAACVGSTVQPNKQTTVAKIRFFQCMGLTSI